MVMGLRLASFGPPELRYYFLPQIFFPTGRAILAKHRARARATRYVARDCNITSRVRNWRLKVAGWGKGGEGQH